MMMLENRVQCLLITHEAPPLCRIEFLQDAVIKPNNAISHVSRQEMVWTIECNVHFITEVPDDDLGHAQICWRLGYHRSGESYCGSVTDPFLNAADNDRALFLQTLLYACRLPKGIGEIHDGIGQRALGRIRGNRAKPYLMCLASFPRVPTGPVATGIEELLVGGGRIAVLGFETVPTGAAFGC